MHGIRIVILRTIYAKTHPKITAGTINTKKVKIISNFLSTFSKLARILLIISYKLFAGAGEPKHIRSQGRDPFRLYKATDIKLTFIHYLAYLYKLNNS